DIGALGDTAQLVEQLGKDRAYPSLVGTRDGVVVGLIAAGGNLVAQSCGATRVLVDEVRGALAELLALLVRGATQVQHSSPRGRCVCRSAAHLRPPSATGPAHLAANRRAS